MMEYLLFSLQYCHDFEIQQLICISWTWDRIHYVSALGMFWGNIVTCLEYSYCITDYTWLIGVFKLHNVLAFFILNCFYCLDRTRSRFFGHIPPTLEEYISLDEELIPLPPVASGLVYEFNSFDNHWENYLIIRWSMMALWCAVVWTCVVVWIDLIGVHIHLLIE